MEKWPETYWKRPIPTAHWQGVSLMTGLIVLGFMVFWETYWRNEGYEPSFEETAELWALERSSIPSNDKTATVLIGSSRVAFGLDLDVWQQDTGGIRPVMLSRVGTCPRPVLRDLAEDEEFVGTVVCGVVPELFFAPDPAPPVQDMETYIELSKNRAISARTDFALGIPLDSAFASLNKEDLSLNWLMRHNLHIPNREGARVMPPLPPYFGRITRDRRYHMWARMEHDPALQKKVQQIWPPLFQMGPPFGGEGLSQLIASVKGNVEKIRSRGGQVIFVRLPSTGGLLDLERQRTPRNAYWDRLLVETGAPGIHFEDYSGLNQFDCPEWSHLTRSDAVTFTRNLLPILQEKLGN